MKTNLKLQPERQWLRVSLFILAITILVVVYIFQRFSITGLMNAIVSDADLNIHPNAIFVINRTLRLILNDVACFILIYVFFQERKYLNIAFWLFLIELLIILPIYFSVKLSLEGDSEISSPLLSQFHRLIVNPTLMILLMMGFFYQRMKFGNSSTNRYKVD